MDYPPQFSEARRAACVAVWIRAKNAYRDRKSQEEFYYHGDENLKLCILEIFAVYGDGVIEMGKGGNLKIESLRQQALEGLRLITIYVSSELLGHSRFLEPGSGYLTQRDRLAFEASEEWRDFESQLLDLATSKSAQVSAGQVDEGPKKPLSWLSIRDAFLEGAQKYSDVVAVWGSSNRTWELRPQTPESSALFAVTARLAIGLLRQSPNEEIREKANTFRKPDQVWLDLMREGERGYVRASTPPLRNFREVAKAADLEFAYGIETPSGVGIDASGIRCVFRESAEFAEDLARRESDGSVPVSPNQFEHGPLAESDEEPESMVPAAPALESERNQLANGRQTASHEMSPQSAAGTTRRHEVDSFLASCNAISQLRINRTHIWRSVGHTASRQFEYWQAGEDRVSGTRGATEQDDQNFRRVLAMKPSDFLTLLRQKGLLEDTD